MIATDPELTGLTVHFSGPAVAANRIAVDDLVLVASRLQDGLERIALVLRGQRGSGRGRRPEDVVARTRLEVVRLGPGGSVALELTLKEPASEQLGAFEADLGRRALRSLVEGIEVLSREHRLPPGWDLSVLADWREIATLHSRGIERIELAGAALLGEERWQGRAVLEPTVQEVIAELLRPRQTERRTVRGRLLMADFKEAGLRCRVHPAAGPAVDCTFDESLKEAILRALTQHVAVTGEAEVDPDTGRIRTLAIEELEVVAFASPGGIGGDFWQPTSVAELAARQGVAPVSDLAALRADFWPADMTADEFLALIDDAQPRGPVPA